jgi:hypothetical protein
MHKTILIRIIATIVILMTGCMNTAENTNSSAIIQDKNGTKIDDRIQQLKTGVLTVPEVFRTPDTYIENKIRVRGRIMAQPHYSAAPCVASEPCPQIINITLHLVDPSDLANRQPTTPLDLFEHTAEDTFMPMTCTFVSTDNFDCNPYTQNAITTVEGTFIKHKIPYHTVGTSDGEITVLKYSDIFILVPGAENLKNTNPCGMGQTPVYEGKGISSCVDLPEKQQ